MKRPILNRWERECIYYDTTLGAFKELALAWYHLARSIDREVIKPLINDIKEQL